MLFKNALSRLLLLCGVLFSLGFADIVSPTFTYISPAYNGATSFVTAAPVVFKVSDVASGDSGINIASLIVSINNVLAVTNDVAQAGYTLTQSVSTNGSWTITLNHDVPFTYLSRQDVTVIISDVSGNTLTRSFYFTANHDGATPLITAVSPTSGATYVPTSSSIVLLVTDNMTGVNMATFGVTFNTISVIKLGEPQSGYTVSSTNVDGVWTVTINPTADLSYWTSYNVATRVNDFSGALRSYSYIFTTAPTPDADVINPLITQVYPVSGRVPTNSGLSFRVTDNQSGVDYNSLTVTIDGVEAIINGVVQSGSFSAVSADISDGFLITINALTDYAYSRNSIPIKAFVRDVSGNFKSSTFYFSTVTSPDATKPSINAYEPMKNALNVSLTAPIVFSVTDNVTDDISISVDSFQVTLNTQTVLRDGVVQPGFTVTMSNVALNNWRVTINPTTPYTYSTSYSIIVKAVDYSDNANTPFAWNFSTLASPPESVPPAITALDPLAAQVGVSTKSAIVFVVTDNSNVILYNSLCVTVSGVTAILNGTVQAGFTMVTTNIGSGFFRVSLNRTAVGGVVFGYNTSVPVVAHVYDSFGNLGSTAYNFVTRFQVPTLNVPDKIVKLSPLTTNIGVFWVTGNAMPNTTVRIFSSLAPTRSIGSTTATTTGSFTVRVFLDMPGTQSIYAQNVDLANGNYSDASKTFVIIPQSKLLSAQALTDLKRGHVTANVSIEVGSVDYDVAAVSFNNTLTVKVQDNRQFTHLLPFTLGVIPSGSTEVTLSATFVQPVVITLNFEVALDAVDYSKVAVYYYSNGTWKKDGITVLQVASNYVVFQTTHFTDFALVVEESGDFKLDKVDTYVAPNPVNLNNNDIQFVYSLGSREKATVSVYVYDLSGALLWKADKEVKTSAGTLSWDGRTSSGLQLSNGAYVAYVVMHDGSWKVVKKVNIAVLK